MTSKSLLCVCALAAVSVLSAADPAAYVPTTAPRTLILTGQEEAFRNYVTTGEGAAPFAKLKADFDRDFLGRPLPAEPLTYGDPHPRTRDAGKADAWRAAQDVAGQVSGIAEAAALLWRVTGDERYLTQAQAYLLGEARWSLDPRGWEQGPRPGGTDVEYNDEAHFRLWRKLPLVYDQIRDTFSPEERAVLLRHYQERGRRSVSFIRRARTAELRYNSLEVMPSSHPVRFMPMTGLTALALWDDLPEEARDWWAFTYRFYAEQFPAWGGDEGGWAEGVAYWRGVLEHATFEDALLAIGDPRAYATTFWRETPYFQLYHVQPYRHTQFGDLSNAGMFNLEPVVAAFMQHLARVQQNGHLVSYAQLLQDPRPTPLERGLSGLDRIYPTAAEFLIRNFIASERPLPDATPLANLPSSRSFADVGWVSMHSALGQPETDIHATFVSSPYGSFSHSHAHQNAFVLNAYGENLAVTGAYREWHNSPHHEGWTRLTKSKNAILIDGQGQRPKDATSTGRITRYEVGPRFTWTTGDATTAYALDQPADHVRRATRDFVFIDQRYAVVRDVVALGSPGRLTWLLHALRPIEWQPGEQGHALIRGERATLTTRLLTPRGRFQGAVRDRADVPVDDAYVRGTALNYSTTGEWTEQSHLWAEVAEPRAYHLVYAVLWPERAGPPARALEVELVGDDRLVIHRPDGQVDRIRLSDDQLLIE